jgi:hypothetical protein
MEQFDKLIVNLPLKLQIAAVFASQKKQKK